MTKEQLITELNFVDHTREKRLAFASFFLENPEHIGILVEILFLIDNKISCKAAWIFEYICREDLNYATPFLDLFAKNIHKIRFDSAVRPVAKIVELMAENHYLKSKKYDQFVLSDSHKELFIECCFDWMIRKEKVAVKAFAMTSLFLFGTEYSWVHPNLKLILEKDFSNSSAAFKARARHILKKLNTA